MFFSSLLKIFPVEIPRLVVLLRLVVFLCLAASRALSSRPKRTRPPISDFFKDPGKTVMSVFLLRFEESTVLFCV